MNKSIKLKYPTFVRWNIIKNENGFKDKTHNEFASFLLSLINNNHDASENETIDVCGVSTEEIVVEEDTLEEIVVEETVVERMITEREEPQTDSEQQQMEDMEGKQTESDNVMNDSTLTAINLSQEASEENTPNAKR